MTPLQLIRTLPRRHQPHIASILFWDTDDTSLLRLVSQYLPNMELPDDKIIADLQFCGYTLAQATKRVKKIYKFKPTRGHTSRWSGVMG